MHPAAFGGRAEIDSMRKGGMLMIDCIYKPKGSRIWRWKFRQQPKDGKIEDVSLGTSDKQVAERRRAERLREKQHERDGLILPKPLREAAQKAISEHLDDFLGDMERLGKSGKYLANLKFRVGALICGCRWCTVKDVTADSFQTWRRGQTELAPKTANDYLEAARCFFNWLIKNGRVQANPLASVEKVRTDGRETRQRRAFTDEEMKALLSTAGERKPIYLMAVHTGLRRSELAALTWGDVRLDAVTPFVQVRASTTKNGKPAAMRLHPEVVAALAEIRGGSQPDELVFKRFPRIERFCRDVKKAGVSYKDGSGQFADFHSLRKTFCTNLAKAGVPSRIAMTLMRHSDRIRHTIGPWSCNDSIGNELDVDKLSGTLTKVQNFRGTICNVKEREYLLRRLNGSYPNEVKEAEKSLEQLEIAMGKLVRLLTWKDFELLCDLIFTHAGWQRITVTGGTEKTIDMELVEPVTGRQIFVQIKSEADLKTFREWEDKLKALDEEAQKYFVVHSPSPDLAAHRADRPVSLLTTETLARLVVSAGLSRWLMQKTS